MKNNLWALGEDMGDAAGEFRGGGFGKQPVTAVRRELPDVEVTIMAAWTISAAL